MKYGKLGQLGKKKKTRTQVNRLANQKLEQLKIEKDIRHCEFCPTQAVTNAHRHPRVWYYDKPFKVMYSWEQVLFLCMTHHTKMDDRSKTTEEEKEEIFINLRGI